MKLQIINSFSLDVKFRQPGESKNSWRIETIVAKFRTLADDDLEALRDEQENGLAVRALLDRVLIDVSGAETDEKKEDGTPYTPLEVAKQNAFSSPAIASAYWDAVNQDIAAKNSKRSRAR